MSKLWMTAPPTAVNPATQTALDAKAADLPESASSARTTADGTPNNLLNKATRYDTTGGAINQPLPAATAGRVFAIGWDAGTAALTLTAAGSDVIGSGAVTSFAVPLAGEVVTYHCTTAGRWRVVSGFKPQSALDGRYLRAGVASIDLCSAPYNATPATDITTALQTALNWIATNCANGGEIYFSVPGTYLISGASQTGTAQSYSYAGQILIPAVSLATSRPIRIRGAFPSSGGGQSTGAPNGVILSSNATSGYVFDIIPSFTQFGCPWTGVMPIFENIVIRTSDNPTCGGLNLQCTQRARLDRVQIDTPTSFVAAPSGSLAGLVMPQVYNNGDVTVRDTTIRGYPIGVLLGEHGVFDNVDVAYCMTAFKGGGISHVNWFGYVDVEECPTMFAGGNAPAFGSPTVAAGTAIMGSLDYENVHTGSLAPVAFVNDATTNPVTGKLNIWGTVSGGFPITGGRSLDLVPVNQTPTLGPKMRGVGWMETHPYDNFKRQVSLSGAGAPGQCSPSLHPWRVESGSFSVVTGTGLKGLTGGPDRCFVPCLKAGSYGGISRTITCTFTLGPTSPTLRIYASAAVNTSGTSINNGTTAVELKIIGGAQPILRANNGNIVSGGSNIAVGSTHTAQIAVYHDAKGYPYAAKVYIDGSLIITSGIPASLITLGGSPSTWPYYEDGLSFGDTGTVVTLFAVQDLTQDPAYVASGTATLVAGTVTVANTAITSGARIRVFNQAAGGTVGALSTSLAAGTSFTINSTSGSDTSTVYYEIVNY